MAEFQTPRIGSSSIPSASLSRFSRVQRWALTKARRADGLSGRFASTPGSEVAPEDLGRGLDLPEQLVALRVAAVVEILDLDQMQPARAPWVS